MQKSGAKVRSHPTLKRVGRDGQRQHERERRIVQAESAVAFIPARGAIVFGIDEQSDAADIFRDADAAIGGAQQESAAESAALHRSIDRKAAEPEHRHVVTRQAFFRERRRPRKFDRRRAQRVEAEKARRPARRRSISRRRFRGSGARTCAGRD